MARWLVVAACHLYIGATESTKQAQLSMKFRFQAFHRPPPPCASWRIAIFNYIRNGKLQFIHPHAAHQPASTSSQPRRHYDSITVHGVFVGRLYWRLRIRDFECGCCLSKRDDLRIGRLLYTRQRLGGWINNRVGGVD